MEYAGRVQRFVAAAIDLVILFVIMVILDVIGIVDVFEAQDRGNVDVAIQAAIGLAYYVPLTAGRGATLGKMALGIKVVGLDGSRARTGSVLIREIIVRSLPVSILPILLGSDIGGQVGLLVGPIVVVFVLFDSKRQGLHDKAAGTLVVRAR